MKRLAAALDTEGGVRLLWWLIALSLVASFFVYLAVGANGPKDPSLTGRGGIAGFGSLGFSVAHGAVTDDFCALLAATDAQRGKGMMGQHDLGGYDAMLFAWPNPVPAARVFFYNQDVPIALSVAWFGADGRFISTLDMNAEDPTPVHAGRDYKFALEVPRGDLGRLGVASGSVLTVKNSPC